MVFELIILFCCLMVNGVFVNVFHGERWYLLEDDGVCECWRLMMNNSVSWTIPLFDSEC